MAKAREKSQDDYAVGEGELRGGPEMGTAVISGTTFTNKAVTYYDVGGVAIIEGDMPSAPSMLLKLPQMRRAMQSLSIHKSRLGLA